MEVPRELVVILTAGLNGDRASIAFTLANTALSTGMNVTVFLTSDGVDLSREGAADLSHARPFAPLAELIQKFSNAGGRILACGSCIQFRALQQEALLPAIEVAGMKSLVERIAAGASTVTF